jgi:hypothetical protein
MKFSVEDYCSKLGWYLVTIPAGTKGLSLAGSSQRRPCLIQKRRGNITSKIPPTMWASYMEPVAHVLLILIM